MIKKSFFLVLTVLLLASTSCKVAQKMVERGDYDGAITLLTKKLAGKKKKKVKYVQALELAFEGATARDMAEIKTLRREGRGENWERIYDIQQKVKRRQRKVSPLLPLYDADGYKADFQFVKVDEMKKLVFKFVLFFTFSKNQGVRRDFQFFLSNIETFHFIQRKLILFFPDRRFFLYI